MNHQKQTRETSTAHRPKACEFCGRDAKPIQGKLRYQHKCKHGTWCVRGNRLLGQHANHPTCAFCQNMENTEYGKRPGTVQWRKDMAKA